MKIRTLQIENFLGVKVFDESPEGDVVVVSGKNGAGKTSVLDSIFVALTGRNPKKPIKDGEDKATIKIGLGEYTVTKTFTKTEDGFNHRLVVESADGATFKSPQKMLDALIGNIAIDPLAFADMRDKEQRDTLLELLGIDLTGLEAEEKTAREERALIGREVKKLEGYLAGMPFDENAPTKEVDVMALVEEKEALMGRIHNARDARYKLEKARMQIVEIEAAHRKAEEELTEAIGETTDPAAFEGWMERETEITTEIGKSAELNLRIQANAARESTKEALSAGKKKYDAFTTEIEEFAQIKTDMFADADLPVPGMSVTEDGVTVDKTPFKQLSAAEQLRASLAMGMAGNPEIKVLRATNGSLVDSDSMKIIEDAVVKNGFQLWLERVDESGKVGIYMEAGEVKKED